MVIKLILAGIAILAVALRPRSRAAAAIALGAGAFSGDIVAAALAAAPMLLFLTVALALAWLAMRSGLTEWAATVLARWGKGRTLRLYALVCSISALLTIVLSLDGAVVLMVPLVSALV